MSASLVGFGDVYKRQTWNCACPETASKQHQTWCLKLWRSGFCTVVPVSYTHLTLPTICSV
eukprot:8695131-Alexandrium_andersonii.AAC.1